MSFPRYKKYKPSGIEWLGDVPAHWKVKRLSCFCDFQSGKAHEPFVDDDGEFICVNSRFVSTEGRSRKYCTKNLSPAQRNDILMVMSDLPNGKALAKAYFVEDESSLAVNQRVCILTPRHGLPRFLFYFLNRSQGFLQHDDGISQTHLSNDLFTKFQTLMPPLSEQIQIAAFLDRETAKIDALVAEQRRLMELLKEKRQAVISHAVTQGLNPKAPMKPSGIEWLGDVPEHWDVKRLKYVSLQITVGIVVEPSKYYAEEGVPALRSLNISPGAVVLDNLVFISKEANDLHSKSKLNAGDLVAVRSGQPGTTAVIPLELDGCNCIDLIIIRKPTSGCEMFLCWYLASDVAVMQFSDGSGGAIQQHFNVGTAINLIIPVPPADEQHAIVAFINSESAKFDTLTAEAQRAINLLQERRTALISAAVTGQIDVRC
jgi:type I restriction enzyme, S subunit